MFAAALQRAIRCWQTGRPLSGRAASFSVCFVAKTAGLGPRPKPKQTPLRLRVSALAFHRISRQKLPHLVVPARHFPANQGEGEAAGIQDRIVELSQSKLVAELQGALP